MARYTKAVNVWALSQAELAQLQPGQWVYAGDPSNKGIWCGLRASSGTAVAAWCGNIQGRPDPSKYITDLIAYAKGGRA